MLAAGDVLVFYTDGIYEARDRGGKMYGFERLQGIIQEVGGNGNAWEILDQIFADVEGFIEGSPHEDNMTIIVVKVG